MSGYLTHRSALSTDSGAEAAVLVNDLDGSNVFDYRGEFRLGVTNGRMFEDAAGVAYLYCFGGADGRAEARVYDGGGAGSYNFRTTLQLTLTYDQGDWVQVKVLIDMTGATNGVCDFYHRAAGADLTDESGWTFFEQVTLPIAGFTAQTNFGGPLSLGNRSGANDTDLRQAYMAGGVGTVDTVIFDVDVRDLSDDEVDNGWTDDNGVEWLVVDGWYAQPGRNGDGPNYLSLIDGAAYNGPQISAGDHSWVPSGGDLEFKWKSMRKDGAWAEGTADYILSLYGIDGERMCYFYYNTDDTLTCYYSPTGFTAGFVSRAFNPDPGDLIDGQACWWKVVVDVDNGAGGWDFIAYTSNDDGETWIEADFSLTSVGSGAYTGGSDFPISIGLGVSASSQFQGDHYEVQIIDDGVTVVDIREGNLSARDLERKAFSEYVNGYKVTLADQEWAYVRPKASIAGVDVEALWMAGDGNKDYSPLWADRSGNGHHARLGSAAGADTNDPVFLAFDGEKYVWLPGTDFNRVDIADDAALKTPTDKMTLQIDMAAADWSTEGAIIAKRTGNYGYFVQTGALGFYCRMGNGTSERAVWVTPTTVLEDWSRHVIKIQFEVGVGYTLWVDGVQEDTTAIVTAGDIAHDTSRFRVGCNSNGGQSMEMTVYSAQAFDSDDDLMVDINFGDAVSPFASFAERANGLSVAIDRAASGYVSTVVDRDMWVLSTDDYFVVPEDPGLTVFAADEDLTLFATFAPFDGTPSGNQMLAGTLNVQGYFLQLEAAALQSDVRGASASGTDNASSPADNVLITAALRHEGGVEVETFVDGVGTGSPSALTAGTIDSGAPFIIGSLAGVSQFFEGQVVAVAVVREALTDDQIAAVSDALLGLSDGAGNLMLMGVA